MRSPDPGATRQRLVFATRNSGKIVEMTALLQDSNWTVDPLPDDVEEFEETGETFAENARGKALHASNVLGVPVLADDSGLEIDALGGEPGVRSARYIDETLSVAERNTAVLDKLRDTPPGERTARFVCHLALANGGRVVHETTGTCEGVIGPSPSGDGGFGYDPLFMVPEIGATFAQISREAKSVHSHRGEATRQMARFLESWTP